MDRISTALALSAGVFWAAFAGGAEAKNSFVVLSSAAAQNMREADATRAFDNLLRYVQPGDTAHVIDGVTREFIGQFSVPANDAYRHPKAKLNLNKKLIGELMGWINRSNAAHAAGMPIKGINYPAVFRLIGSHYPASEPTDVLVIASPLFHDPKDPEFSMAEGLVPGDGHLLVSRDKSVFGVRGQQNLLRNFRVHWIADSEWRRFDRHELFVHRFLTLYIERLGGRLIRFADTAKPVLDGWIGAARYQPHSFRIQRTDKLEMIRPGRAILDEQQANALPPIFERVITGGILTQEEIANARDVEIGISWPCPGCDLDLYVQAHPRAQPLYYGRKETPEGNYYKDYQTSPETSNGLETVKLNIPVDLGKLLIAINFYAGTADNTTGEIRMTVNGLTYAYRFKIAAKTGNEADGAGTVLSSRRVINDAWVIIDPLEIGGVVRGDG